MPDMGSFPVHFHPRTETVDAHELPQCRSSQRGLARLDPRRRYVIDRNHGVPLALGAANGYTYQLGDEPYNDPDLDDAGDWAKYEASGVGQAMDDIRRNVRMVVGQSHFVTADGKKINPQPGCGVNLLSLRGGIETPWVRTSAGGRLGTYDVLTNRLSWTDAKVRQMREGDTTQTVKWAGLRAGEPVRMTVTSTRGATMRLQVVCDKAVVYNSKALGNGGSVKFNWPRWADPVPVLTAFSGQGKSWVEVDLRRTAKPKLSAAQARR